MGKRVNFSIVYGAGSSKIGKDAGLTPKQAQEFLKRCAAHAELAAALRYCVRGQLWLLGLACQGGVDCTWPSKCRHDRQCESGTYTAAAAAIK